MTHAEVAVSLMQQKLQHAKHALFRESTFQFKECKAQTWTINDRESMSKTKSQNMQTTEG